MEYAHEWVNHNKGEYVRGIARQTASRVLGPLLSVGYKGTYHHWGRKHLPLYIAEFVARYNTRPCDTIDQMIAIVEGIKNKRLRYRELVA